MVTCTCSISPPLGTSTPSKIPQATQVSGTQTSSSSSSPPSCTTNKEDSVRFSKHLGGVSYLERLMVRRHRIDPHFLAAAHKSKQSLRAGKAGQNEWELDGLEEEEDTKRAPSQYNLFYARRESKEGEVLCDQLSSPVCLEVDDFPHSRPVSSVRIEEVTFQGSQRRESVNAKTAPQESKAASSTNTQQKKLHDRGADRKYPVKASKTKAMRDGTATRGKEKVLSSKKSAPLAPPQKGSSPNRRVEETATAQPQQSLADSIRQTWAANPRISSTTRSTGHLSEFFLAGVETTTTHNQIGKKGEKDIREEATVGGYSSRSILPISATIWLPENSSLTENHDQPPTEPREERPSHHSSASSPHGPGRPNPLLSQIHPSPHSSLHSTPSSPLHMLRV